MTSIPTAKKAARSQVRARRRLRRDAEGAAADRARAAAGLTRHAMQLVEHWRLAPGTVTVYESWATEPPTDQLMDAFQSAGWRVLVPITKPDLSLSWRERGSETDLGPATIAEATLVLVPALSIAGDGTRLGQGGGCYDRTLPRRGDGVPVAAIVWDEEVVDTVPADEHDAKVAAIITPERVVIPTA